MVESKEILNILALLDNKDVKEKLGEIVEETKTAGETMKGVLGAQVIWDGLKKGAEIAKQAIAAVTNEMSRWVSEAGEDRLLATRLDTTMQSLGMSANHYRKELDSLYDSTWKMAGLTDDFVNETLSKYLQMSGNWTTSTKAVTAAIALGRSGIMGMDEAVQNVGMTLTGFVSERGLGRLIPALKGMTEEELKAGKGLDFIIEKFGQFTGAMTGSFSDSMDRFSGALGEVRGALGAGMEKTLGGMLGELSDKLMALSKDPELARTGELLGDIANNGIKAIGEAFGIEIDGHSVLENINSLLSTINENVKSEEFVNGLTIIATALTSLAGASAQALGKLVDLLTLLGSPDWKTRIKAGFDFASGASNFGVTGFAETAVETIASGFSSGGRIPGAFDARDNHLAFLSSGEVVLTPQQQAMIGTEAIDSVLRSTGGKMGGPFFSSGGWAGAVASIMAGTPSMLDWSDPYQAAQGIIYQFLAGGPSAETALSWAQNRMSVADASFDATQWGTARNAYSSLESKAKKYIDKTLWQEKQREAFESAANAYTGTYEWTDLYSFDLPGQGTLPYDQAAGEAAVVIGDQQGRGWLMRETQEYMKKYGRQDIAGQMGALYDWLQTGPFKSEQWAPGEYKTFRDEWYGGPMASKSTSVDTSGWDRLMWAWLAQEYGQRRHAGGYVYGGHYGQPKMINALSGEYYIGDDGVPKLIAGEYSGEPVMVAGAAGAYVAPSGSSFGGHYGRGGARPARGGRFAAGGGGYSGGGSSFSGRGIGPEYGWRKKPGPIAQNVYLLAANGDTGSAKVLKDILSANGSDVDLHNSRIEELRDRIAELEAQVRSLS